MTRRRGVVLAATLLLAAGAPAALAQPAALPPAGRVERPELPKARDVNDWREYYEEGVRLVSRRWPRAALPYFQWAMRLNPQSAEPVHMQWVALTMANGRLLETEPGKGSARDEAERARIDSVLLEALRIDPFTPRHYARYMYELRPGYWGRDRFTQGYLAYTEARYDRALDLLARERQGRRERPARMFRALTFHAMERYDSAAVELEALAALVARENATTMSPSYESAAVFLYGIGVARQRLGDLEGAREALQRALAEDVSMAAAHVALAQVALARGDTATVLRAWEIAVELRPQSPAMHGEHGNALRALGRHAEAVAAYERAIALEPWWANPWFNLAITLDGMGRGAEAVPRYAQFLERAPQALARQMQVARGRLAALAIAGVR